MNLQGMTVIFAIILLPIVLVVSVYMQGQIDTIELQTQYDNMLINATHDAVTALEQNIANEDLSTVSDSLRSMIEASNNIFTNSLSINMGASNASKNYIRPYIPALLYTLYDGFYIYSPTSVPKVAEDEIGVARKSEDSNTYGQLLYERKKNLGGGETADINEAETNIDYVLKPYIYYNANYEQENIKISVNYSLDNYISISGSIGEVYYSKSGYLINPNLVDSITLLNSIDGNRFAEGEVKFNLQGSKFNNDEEVFYRKYQDVIEKLSENGGDLLELKDEEIISDFCKLNGIQMQVVLNVPTKSGTEKITITTVGLEGELREQAIDAICYCAKAKIFSDWVKENLRSIQPTEESLKNYPADYVTTYMTGESTTKYLYSGDYIFDIGSNNNPEDSTSAFCEHKREVIKSSIQYNLNNAISNYSSMSQSGFEYEMPIMSETEWDVILSNVTMVSFMQGMPCKGKTYNNYAIVPSTSSEITVIPDNLYYVEAEKSNPNLEENPNQEVASYHRIGCSKLNDSGNYLGYRNIEYIYDEKLNDNGQYEYDHKNFGCYECIISTNYTKTSVEDLVDDNKKRAYYTVLGKERNNVYKTTATVDNYGFEVFPQKNGENISINTARNLDEIKSIEIVITETEISNNRTKSITDIIVTGTGGINTTLSVNANNKTTQTIRLENISSNQTTELKNLSIDKNDLTTLKIASVKVIYK